MTAREKEFIDLMIELKEAVSELKKESVDEKNRKEKTISYGYLYMKEYYFERLSSLLPEWKNLCFELKVDKKTKEAEDYKCMNLLKLHFYSFFYLN